MKTIQIKELKIEVELKETQKDTSFSKIKIPKGWRLLTGTEAMLLWENYRKKIKMGWFFVKPTIGFKVAGFWADSDWAYLVCDSDTDYSSAKLRVRFCRDWKK